MGYLAEDHPENGQALIQSLHVPAGEVRFTIHALKSQFQQTSFLKRCSFS